MNIEKQIQAGTSGLDIIHGELKVLMCDTEQDLEGVSEYQDGPVFNYLSGVLDAYSKLYKLTYDISFAGGK